MEGGSSKGAKLLAFLETEGDRRDGNKSQGETAPSLSLKWIRRARECLKHIGVPQELSGNRHSGARTVAWVPGTGGGHACAVQAPARARWHSVRGEACAAQSLRCSSAPRAQTCATFGGAGSPEGPRKRDISFSCPVWIPSRDTRLSDARAKVSLPLFCVGSKLPPGRAGSQVV